jgi:hypothetical protein
VGDETHYSTKAGDGHAALLIYLDRDMGSPNNVRLRKKVVTAALATVGRLSVLPATEDAIADAELSSDSDDNDGNGTFDDDDNKNLAQTVLEFLWMVCV